MIEDARVFIDQFDVAFHSTSEVAQIVYTMNGSEPTQNSIRRTWYRDHWMYKDYSIKAGAKGEFVPLTLIKPKRIKEE